MTAPVATPTLDATHRAISDFMAGASLEVTTPTPAEVAEIAAILEPGTEVFVSAIPRQGPNGQLETCARISEAGLRPVPHVAARSFASPGALEAFVARARDEAGVSIVLIVAGDRDRPVGPFADAMSLLEQMDLTGFDEIAVAGYPSGHPTIDAAALDASLTAKAEFLDGAGKNWRIVTQFGFDPGPIMRWIATVRDAGIGRTISVGMAGPASIATLVRFAARCGVAAAGRGLARNASAFGRLIGDSGPEPLIHLLAEAAAGETLAAVRPHFFSFGGAVRTAKWINAVQTGRFVVEPAGFRVDV